MLLIKDPFFCDPLEDKALPVIELDESWLLNPTELSKDYFYLIGDTLYEYVGRVTSAIDADEGTIGKVGDRYYLVEHSPESKPLYNVKFVIEKSMYDARVTGVGIEDAVVQYLVNSRASNNIMKAGNIKIIPSGNVYMPEIYPDDDPLERIVKLMLRHIKVVLSDHRGEFNKKHQIDNIKSALDGATKNMSITKFLGWCDGFGWDWEFTFDNVDSGVDHPMEYPVIVSSKYPLPWEDIPPETKECFTVPLTDGEDPLKRAIKLVLFLKRIDLRDYKHKSPTPHLLNNMKSALKSKQKMTMLYTLAWCEIIDLEYTFKIINQDGIWYKITGFDVTTNGEEE